MFNVFFLQLTFIILILDRKLDRTFIQVQLPQIFIVQKYLVERYQKENNTIKPALVTTSVKQ